MSSRIEVKTAGRSPGRHVRTSVVEVMARQRPSLRERVSAAQRVTEDAAMDRLQVDLRRKRHEAL